MLGRAPERGRAANHTSRLTSRGFSSGQEAGTKWWQDNAAGLGPSPAPFSCPTSPGEPGPEPCPLLAPFLLEVGERRGDCCQAPREELPGGSAAATLSQRLLMKRFSLGLFPLGINGGVRNSTFIWKCVSISCSRAQQNKWYDTSASNAAAHCGVKPHLPVLLAYPAPPSAAGTRVPQSTAG